MGKKSKKAGGEPTSLNGEAVLVSTDGSGGIVFTKPEPERSAAPPAPEAAAAPSRPAASDKDKLNTSNLPALKVALDDAVKQHFGRPTAFTPSNVHDDVRLALGWSSIFIAFGTAYYGYRVPFEESKFWVSIGVTLYVVLSGIYLLYEKYVVRNIVFVGKRRTVTTRVETERLTISSSIPPSPTAPKSPYTYLASLLSPSPSPLIAAKAVHPFPTYALKVAYVQSSNNGKVLIHHAEKELDRPVGDWFDKEGTMDREGFEKALEGLLVGVIGQ